MGMPTSSTPGDKGGKTSGYISSFINHDVNASSVLIGAVQAQGIRNPAVSNARRRGFQRSHQHWLSLLRTRWMKLTGYFLCHNEIQRLVREGPSRPAGGEKERGDRAIGRLLGVQIRNNEKQGIPRR